MNNKVKRFFICLSVFLLLVALTPRNAVYAEEYTDPEGNVYVFRWKWTYINSNNTVRKCRVKANGENLRSSWQSYYSSAVEHWNTLGAQHNDLLLDKVYMYNVPFAQSKLDFYSATSENLSWFYDGDFQNIRGIALFKNINNQWFINPDNGEPGSFTGGSISYARIYVKTTAYSLSDKNKHYIFRHETGHVLGMGHVALGAQNSIMAPSYVNNCYGVKIYDLNVLEGFYPNP